MRNKQRVTALENKTTTHTNHKPVWIVPNGTDEEIKRFYGKLDTYTKTLKEGEKIVILPDNKR